MCVYVHKVCEKFGGCKLFSWLGQKVNKQTDGSDAYMATMLTTSAWTCARGHGMMPPPTKTS